MFVCSVHLLFSSIRESILVSKESILCSYLVLCTFCDYATIATRAITRVKNSFFMVIIVRCSAAKLQNKSEVKKHFVTFLDS